MEASDAIMAALSRSGGNKIDGKKRLQKIVYFMKEAGVEIDTEYYIYQFGPFSKDVVEACDFLSIIGAIKESEEAAGDASYFTSSFSILNNNEVPHLDGAVEAKINTIVQTCESFRTITLEVASTILYFIRSGLNSETAIEKTRAMKPRKTTENTLNESRRLLKSLELATL